MKQVARVVAVSAALVVMADSPRAGAQEAAPRQDVTAVPVVRSFDLAGVGVGFLPSFSGARELRPLVLPILRLDYKDRVFLNVLQGGVWIVDALDKDLRIGLAVEPRFGWEAEDGTRVEGMERREFSVEGGPNVQWRTPVGVFNANLYQDLSGASNGQTAQLQFIRPLTSIQALSPRLRVNGVAGLQWLSERVTDYYFGVRPQEARIDRPAYGAGATTNAQLGLNGVYLLGRGSVLFGVIGNWLGSEAASSPIVETRFQPVVYAGYGVSF